ncbi:hypothetical protein [Sphingomonas sp. Leaf343]|uniref:hypothetical protein n=1 Tax=Sphingomonas sp. Leaf343 TaxID=1736345 RepID=UPI0006F6DDE5|nr:hypothetical protein [Sphingomonas sp. Leaf343]KQR84155.1 hypothetical protein ASG07_06085 [Sphingomonas sp. Leaf343]
MLDLVEADIVAPRRGDRVLPALAVVLALAWIGGMLALAWTSLPALPPVALVQFVAALATVPALIGIVWLLAQRSSRSEARRFALTARAMRGEAQALERRIAALSQSLHLQREQIAHQLSTLASVGDVAADRLEAVGRGLSAEVDAARAHAATLATAAERARATVGELLAAMPAAQADSEEVGRRIEQAGLGAAAHVAALDAQLSALTDRAREADTLSTTAVASLAGHLQRIGDSGHTAGSKLEQVAAAMAETVELLATRATATMERSRADLADQGDAMLGLVDQRQAALHAAAHDSVSALGERVGAIDAAIELIANRLHQQHGASDILVGGLHDGIAAVEQRLDALHAQGVDRTQHLAASISALGGSANAMTEALKTGDAMALKTIGTTESLLIALDAAAREIDETLPEALNRLDARIDGSRKIVGQAKPELLALVTAAESTHDAIEAIAAVIQDQRKTLDQLSMALLDTLENGRDKADALGAMVDETIGRTNRFADEAAPRLLEALTRVRETAQIAADRARETLAKVIPEAAAALEDSAGDAMRRATTNTVERQVDALAEATRGAVTAATGATERLAAHVQRIAEQTALVEARLEEAREVQEQADSATLSRRVSLLIEALNSASIDIAKVFGRDVSDSAWAAYLKGDRGVFTRRAVRLLEGSELARVSRLYDDDAVFRDNVNRYIHDFEAMLRGILTQRDGSPLAVTLLSSDMGKLYVALAQAIERLR